MRVVLDTSAVLAALWGEPGSARVDEVISDSLISAVNLSELIAKLVDRGAEAAQVTEILADLALGVVAFDRSQAGLAGELRRQTRDLGLSLGDRACLALAIQQGVRVITADRAWGALDIGIQVEVIR